MAAEALMILVNCGAALSIFAGVVLISGWLMDLAQSLLAWWFRDC